MSHYQRRDDLALVPNLTEGRAFAAFNDAVEREDGSFPANTAS